MTRIVGLGRTARFTTVLVLALVDDTRVRRAGRCPGIDSCHVVHECIDYAEHIARIPSISELCLAAHVSERRLRAAFSEVCEMPSSRFFRAWALEKAHRRLRAADPDDEMVTTIACDLGFLSLGRFAGRYGRLYGESPSTTLRRTA